MPDEEATPPVHTVDGLRPPKGLKLSGADANWKKYKQLFEIYIEAAGLEKVRENRKIAIFLNAGGEEVVEVYNTLKEKDKGSLKALFSALDAYAEPLKSLVLKTYEFLNYRQQDGEAIDHFVTRLKNQGKKCELGEMEDRLVAIMLVIGIADSSLKERLLREESLDLDRAVTICRAAEAGRKQLQGIGGMAKENIDAFRKTTVRSQRREKETGKSEGNKLCSKCGLHHEARKCPAFGRRCAVCSKYNHYAKQCRSNKKQEEKKLSERKKVHAVEEEDSTDSDNNVYLSSILTNNSVKQQWLVKIMVCEKELEFKIDTGADCNTLSLKTYNKIKDNNCVLKRSKNVSLIVYNGEKINTVGQAELDCYYKNKSKVLTFNIIDLPVQPVIGLPDCIKLNLVKRVESLSQSNSTKESFVKQYKDVFKGLGEIGTYKIKVKANAVPVIKPIRRVPHAIKDRLKETLDNYEKRGVIEKVEGPTEWCNNVVIVEKPDGSLRLCLDPKELNINILRENFLIPSPEEIYNNLQGKQVFSVLDMKDGFFQIKLVDEKNLCTFGTPFGRYKFNRMPFGISSAPEVMQKMNTDGRKILIETDHKPLVAIMSKDISKVSARLQRMVLKLLKYNFEIKYIPGSQMYVADYLSRNFCNNKQEEPTLQEIVHTIDTEIVYGLEKELPISKEKLQILKNETLRDANLQSLLSWYSNGWPSNDRSFDNKELKVFYKLRNDIHVHNDIIHYKDRIVVPKHLRQEMIKCIHEGHAGVVKCKQRARRVLFWPGMSVDIENFVLGCKACEKFRPSNPKEPLMSHEVPDIPFHKVGVDICTFSGKDYLVLIDYYSKWIEVKYLKEKTACNVIKQFKVIMSVHGIPKICVSDNMPFSSFEFKKFAKEYDIELIHSSPRYPQSNGMSEKAVGIVKSLLKKCKEDGSDFAMGLLAYRTTPVAGLEYSPSELLMSRLLRTTLPCVFDKLKPKLPIDVKEKMKTIKEKYTQNYDRTAKTKKSFEKGENVVIQNLPNKTWLPGKVLEKVKLRSYKVINEEGNVVRRNEKHINPSKNELVIKKEVLDSDRPVIDNSQDDNNVVPNVQEQNVSTEVPISTKSGRVVRTPQHLKDYHVY